MRENIDEPIAAILTLNTIAHTVGASMGGALALEVFGDRWIALFSAMVGVPAPPLTPKTVRLQLLRVPSFGFDRSAAR